MRGAFAVAVVACLVACETPSQPGTSPDGWYSLTAQALPTESGQTAWLELPSIDDPRQGCWGSMRGGGTLRLDRGRYSLDMSYTSTCAYSPGSPYHEEGLVAEAGTGLTFDTQDPSRPTRILDARRGSIGNALRPTDTIDLHFVNPGTWSEDYIRFNRVQPPAR